MLVVTIIMLTNTVVMITVFMTSVTCMAIRMSGDVVRNDLFYSQMPDAVDRGL